MLLSSRQRFFLQVGLLLPLALIALAVAVPRTGLDAGLSAAFYDAHAQRFLVSGSGWLDLLGHRLGKSLVLALWLLIGAAAVASHWVPRLAAHRRLLWTLVVAMGAGPILVTLLKDINTHACPWSLKAFGGSADYSAEWFVSRLNAGRCFPSGHAAGGFSLVALAFAGEVMNQPRLRRLGLWLGLLTGAAFSLLRIAQGAHFLSHNLWSAAIDLATAALAFALLAPDRAAQAEAAP
ncbi:phosphatase PAP2 family protein [Piscinibacter sp.]|uniref:phosphatase PAP2 family protein n=1 Tax=Piscinibacter sp. TaxID=1903157 RepID=UPI0039E360CE